MAKITDGSSPGQIPEGQTCDKCPNLARHRILVERDSRGCEYADMCDACYSKIVVARNERRKAGLGTCGFCRSMPAIQVTRDPDEPNGEDIPICGACVDHLHEQIQDENDAFELDAMDQDAERYLKHR